MHTGHLVIHFGNVDIYMCEEMKIYVRGSENTILFIGYQMQEK